MSVTHMMAEHHYTPLFCVAPSSRESFLIRRGHRQLWIFILLASGLERKGRFLALVRTIPRELIFFYFFAQLSTVYLGSIPVARKI